ncbi:MAG: S-methyl-5-thioribose-1-phosphate isomerase [Candidatus Thermoplasmatota archaeon]|nr:S-methyl-5-thioribose-1-phosphate isomerase [Candidatus Thermoplasmatota archaeon]MBS3789606.1 S-methyl-5-thioribose-1-phosphate isomerase [Candidatus Thermoplasmatota archaeon]
MKIKMEERTKDLPAVWMEDEKVKMIDQRYLPQELKFFTAEDYEDIHKAIKDMMVRGAPAIGVTAAFGIAQAKLQEKDIEEAADHIKSARPTAYDLFYAVDHMLANLDEPTKKAKEYSEMIKEKCRRIGKYGNELIKDGHDILTHCNAGALATIDYGTALAPMRAANKAGKKIHVYVDETRPRLQGARLTAWELYNEDIPHSVIVDNASGHYIQRGEIDMVIVGTDRIVANGDIANKIGTYEKAVLAKENDIPFYVAAPVTTYDKNIKEGMKIPIEEREEKEVREINGLSITPEGSPVKNPAFDVTPAKYIDGYITEKGIFSTSELKDIF